MTVYQQGYNMVSNLALKLYLNEVKKKDLAGFLEVLDMVK